MFLYYTVLNTNLLDVDAFILVSDNDLGDLYDYKNIYNQFNGFAVGYVDNNKDDEDLWDLYNEVVSYFDCLLFD